MTKRYKNRNERNRIIRISAAARTKRERQEADERKTRRIVERVAQHTEALKRSNPELYEKFIKVLKDHPHFVMEDGSIHFKEDEHLFTDAQRALFKNVNETVVNPDYVDELRPVGNDSLTDVAAAGAEVSIGR